MERRVPKGIGQRKKSKRSQASAKSAQEAAPLASTKSLQIPDLDSYAVLADGEPSIPAGGNSQVAIDLAHSFFALLMRHRMYFQNMFGQLGLSPTHVQILQLLSDGASNMRELSAKSMCEPSNLTGVIDKLEQKNLVQRRIDAQDRRIKVVSLTRSGKSFRDKLMERMGQPVPWMMTLSSDDQQQLLTIINRALANMPSKDS